MPNLEWIIFTEVNYENSLHPSRKDADSFQLKSLSRERSLSTADTYTSTSMQVCKFVSSLSFWYCKTCSTQSWNVLLHVCMYKWG